MLPSLREYENFRTKILQYNPLRFNDTFDIPPQIAVNTEWPCYRAVTVYTLKLFRNGILERIYAPKRKEITGSKKRIINFS